MSALTVPMVVLTKSGCLARGRACLRYCTMMLTKHSPCCCAGKKRVAPLPMGSAFDVSMKTEMNVARVSGNKCASLALYAVSPNHTSMRSDSMQCGPQEVDDDDTALPHI